VNPGRFVEVCAADGSIRNVIGTPNIDYFDSTAVNEAADQYRPGDQTEAGKGPNNGGDSNKDRGGRTITADWVMGWTAANEWANYTRTFPNAAYRAFVRWGSGAGAGTPMNLILDEVTSDPALPSQTLRRIGTFNNPAPTGAWDGAFIYSPMLDAGGAPAAVRLSGKKTLRATVGNGAMDYNYIVFIPDPSVGVLRVTATPSPANNATSSSRDPLIRVVFTDRDTAVVAGTIRLEVNGTDVTGV